MPEVPFVETAETIFNDYWNMITSIQARVKTLPLYEAHLLQEMMKERILKATNNHPEIMELFKEFIQ